MDLFPEERTVRPTPQPPKTIGILNIVFGVILMLFTGCCGVYTVFVPFGMGMAAVQQEQARAQQKAAFQAELDNLRHQEEVTDDEGLKEQLRAQRAEIEAQHQQQDKALDSETEVMKSFQDPRIIGHFGAEVVTGLILDLLMFVSGIGLIGLKEWARKLALAVAGLKIFRLLALLASMILLVVPTITAILERIPAKPGDPQSAQFPETVGQMVMIYGIALLLLGSIYPAISVWVLSLAGTRAACQPRPAPETGPQW